MSNKYPLSLLKMPLKMPLPLPRFMIVPETPVGTLRKNHNPGCELEDIEAVE